MKKLFIIQILSLFSFTSFCQESPFGTGIVNNQDIGILDDPDVIFASNTGYGNFTFLPDPDGLLASYTYDLYIPPSYDGTESYGLVTWINSGNNGAVKPEWIPVLDANKLIWVGGDNIGNPITIDIRMGVAWAAVYRFKEILNIDTSRIFTSGNSGGARMANTLAYLYPEWISGSLPNCGSAYPIAVDQDYETHDPDSHYEVILPLTTDDVEYIKSYEQRYGIMTSYGDFREGDIMNIYHNGMEPAGFEARFFEKSGGHCSTATWHFEDAVHFVDHSFEPIIDDQFEGDDATGAGYVHENTVQTESLLLEGNLGDLAQLKTVNIVEWNDPKGAILRTTISLDDDIEGDLNTSFHLGFWDYYEGEQFCLYDGDHLEAGQSGILLTVNFDSGSPQILLQVEDDEDGIDPVTLFNGTFSDWSATNELDIKVHLWAKEIRVEFNHHFNDEPFTAAGTTFLDDKRSIQARWENTSIGLWEGDQWENGAFITYASSQIDPDIDGGNINVSNLVLKTDLPADTYTIGTLDIIESGLDLVGSDDALTDYQWFLNDAALPGETSYTLGSFPSFGVGEFYLTAQYTDGCQVSSNRVESNDYIGVNKNNLSQLKVYPNPFKDEFIITNINSTDVQIFNALGKNMTDKVAISAESKNEIHIQTIGLNSGIYFLVYNGMSVRILKY